MNGSSEKVRKALTPKRVTAVAALTVVTAFGTGGVFPEQAEGKAKKAAEHCRPLKSLVHLLENKFATGQEVPFYSGHLAMKNLQIQIPMVIDRCKPRRDPSSYPDPHSARFAYGSYNRVTHHIELLRYNEQTMKVTPYFDEPNSVHPATMTPEGFGMQPNGQLFATPFGTPMQVAEVF